MSTDHHELHIELLSAVNPARKQDEIDQLRQESETLAAQIAELEKALTTD